MKDVTLELDDFSRNMILSGTGAMAQQLYNLLIMEPGDSPDVPEKGINMRSYRFGIADEAGMDLKTEIEKQVSLYCDFDTSEVEVVFKDGELIVGIRSPAFSEIMIFRSNSESILTTIINE